jgi:hypothetical protein
VLEHVAYDLAAQRIVALGLRGRVDHCVVALLTRDWISPIKRREAGRVLGSSGVWERFTGGWCRSYTLRLSNALFSRAQIRVTMSDHE